MKKLFIFMTLFLFLFCGWASATSYYVTSSGSRGGDGSAGNPWQGFSSINWSSLGGGDILDGMGKTYTETLYIGASGSASGQLVIQNMNFANVTSWAAIYDNTGQDYITLQDIYMDLSGGGTRGITTGTQAKTGWVIQRVEVHNVASHCMWPDNITDLLVSESVISNCGMSSFGEGFHIENSTNFVVEYCEGYDANGTALFDASDSAGLGPSTGIFRYNYAHGGADGHDASSYGFKISGYGGKVDIIGNVVDKTYYGIAMQEGISGDVHNNLVNNTSYIGIYGGATGGYDFKNNLVTNSVGDGMVVYVTDGTVDEDYNLVWISSGDLYISPRWAGYSTLSAWQSGTVYGDNDISSDPDYTDDLRLEGGSPAIGAGVDVGYNMGINPNSTWPDNVIIESIVGGPHMGPWSKAGISISSPAGFSQEK